MAGLPNNFFPALHNSYEEDEMETFLWSFTKTTQPETLQDVGIELNLSHALMCPVQPSTSSGHMVPENVATASEGPSTSSGVMVPENVATTREEPSTSSGHLVPENIATAHEEPSTSSGHMLPENVATAPEGNASNGERGVTGITEMPSARAGMERRTSDGARKNRARKEKDDDSWIPEGWVKVVKKRSSAGKYPDYEDKKYYAPGVRKPFRSKVSALRYINTLSNATRGGV